MIPAQMYFQVAGIDVGIISCRREELTPIENVRDYLRQNKFLFRGPEHLRRHCRGLQRTRHSLINDPE